MFEVKGRGEEGKKEKDIRLLRTCSIDLLVYLVQRRVVFVDDVNGSVDGCDGQDGGGVVE